MSGIVEFIIKMQDKLSGPLAHVSKNSSTAQKNLDKLTESNKQLKAMIGSTGAAINNQNSVITKYGSLLSGILPGALTLVGAGAGIAAAFNQGLKNAQNKVDFQLLIGDKAGDNLFKNIKGMGGAQVIGEDRFAAGKQLVEAGVGVEKIVPLMGRLGDVSMGSNEKFKQLVGTFSQIQKDGKLTESTLDSLNSAGFKPLNILADITGEKLSKVQQRFENGKISVNDITKALEGATAPGGQFYGVMDKIGNSPLKGWEGLKTKLFEITSTLGDKLLPIAESVFDLLSSGIDWLNKGIEWTVGLFEKTADWAKRNEDILWALGGAVLAGAAAYAGYNIWQRAVWLWQMRDLVGTSLLATGKGLLTTVTAGLTIAQSALNAAFIASPIGWVVTGIAALVGGVIYAWKHFEGFRKVIYGVWETFKEVFNSIGKLFKQIFSPIGEALQAVKEGRWMDAAKATGKLLFNITPAGILMKTAEFSKNGGWSNVSGAYELGAAKGAASWLDSQKKEESPTDKLFGTKTGEGAKEAYWNKKDKKDKPADDKINAVSGGGVKNIYVTVHKMIETMENHFTNVKEGSAEIERIVEEAMVRAVASASGR